MDKKTKFILEQILDLVQQIYPKMDRIVLSDLDNPRSIMITNDEAIDEIAKDFGIDPAHLDDIAEYIELDDDDDNGTLQ